MQLRDTHKPRNAVRELVQTENVFTSKQWTNERGELATLPAIPFELTWFNWSAKERAPLVRFRLSGIKTIFNIVVWNFYIAHPWAAIITKGSGQISDKQFHLLWLLQACIEAISAFWRLVAFLKSLFPWESWKSSLSFSPMCCLRKPAAMM